MTFFNRRPERDAIMTKTNKRRVQLTFGLTMLAGWLASEGVAHAAEVPIVYTRCPRGHQAFPFTGKLVKNGVTTMPTVMVPNGDLLEPLPEVARAIGDFVAPCDLVYRDEQGSERILYDCISGSTKDNACAALDAAVSFDAKTVAFTVFRGPLERLRGAANGKIFDPAAENLDYVYVEMLGSVIHPTESQIVLVDIATGKQTPLPFPPGTQNFGPTWLSNGRLVFSSAARRPIHSPMPLCTNASGPSIQLYAMDSDARNLELVSPHALAAELHPLQLADGRVALSSWQNFGLLAYRHGNSWAGCGTITNFFHIYTQNPDGSGATALYGQHVGDPTGSEYQFLGTHMAAHFLGQTTDGRIWTSEYYRGNNLGLGSVIGFPAPPAGQEGPTVQEAAAAMTSAYRAPDQVRLASWASSADQESAGMPDPPLNLPGYVNTIKYAGKLGHPSGLPGNKLMVTWGVGICNTASNDVAGMMKLSKDAGDNPACDTGIYRTGELPAGTPNIIKHPSELVQIVNSPDFHEFLARPVVPYSAIHGIDHPKDIPRAELSSDAALEHGTPFGVLGASSIIHRETHPLKPIDFDNAQAADVGTDTIDYNDEELCGIRILAVNSNIGNGKQSYEWKSTSTVGERVEIIGEFPVRNWDANGKPILDSLGMQDTSFKVRFPADTPYLMQGIDCEGRTLNTDQTWQSLRPGEVKTCNGCHVHSAAATKLPFSSTLAGEGKAVTRMLGEGKVPLLTGGSGPNVTQREVDGFGYEIEFDTAVWPILQTRCVSCHEGAAAAAGLRLDIPRDWDKVNQGKDDSTYFRLALDSVQQFVPPALQRTSPLHGTGLGKPNLSRYMRMMNSRGSLLYWKAKNARTDNRTDAQIADDIDFGADHPTQITPEELGILARWIDTGAGWGPEFTDDLVFPALHVVGVADKDTVTAIHIGTADVGRGIDPDSLTACIIPTKGAECGPNLAGKAALSGVVTITPASPLTDPDAEVWVTVKDLAGNLTEARRTVRFLLALPPPVPETPDGGVASTGASGSGGSGGASGGGKDDGGCGCRVAPPPSSPLGLGLMAGLGLALFLRRKRS
jgi:MYXO-CTERM domain-containing protein